VLLTIPTTHLPATDLGYLLHKNPGRHHVAEVSFGTAHVYYPQADDDLCRAAVQVDIDRSAWSGTGTDRRAAVSPSPST
jgi:RNA repair, ligase-Pnkp-associating, region of Hen1